MAEVEPELARGRDDQLEQLLEQPEPEDLHQEAENRDHTPLGSMVNSPSSADSCA